MDLTSLRRMEKKCDDFIDIKHFDRDIFLIFASTPF